MLTGYKIVTPKLKSLNAEGKAQVQYKINEWVSAPDWLADLGYYLFYFDTLENAKMLVMHYRYCLVYYCEAMELFHLPLISIPSGYLKLGVFQPYRQNDYLDWGKGALMAKKIKLLTCVNHELEALGVACYQE